MPSIPQKTNYNLKSTEQKQYDFLVRIQKPACWKGLAPVQDNNFVVVFVFVTHTLRGGASAAYLCFPDLFCFALCYHKFLYASWIHKSIHSGSFILLTAESIIVYPSRLPIRPPHDCQFIFTVCFPLPMTSRPGRLTVARIAHKSRNVFWHMYMWSINTARRHYFIITENGRALSQFCMKMVFDIKDSNTFAPWLN